MDMPLPLAPPFPVGPTTSAEIETVTSLRKTVLNDPYIEFELYGNQFRFRSSDRAGRKFKHKETIEL
jgi:ribonuclease P protein subunit POP4